MIDSSVYRPGIYEIKNESVKELIKYAGGLKPTSSSKLIIKRIKPIDQRSKNENLIYSFYLDYNDSENEKIVDGDLIIAPSIFTNQSWVEIIGQVKKPGYYNYFDGMTLKNLIDLGGGFEDTSFWKSVYHKKAEIIRRDPNSRYEKSINVNLNEIYIEKTSENILLQNLDRFVVHANLNFLKEIMS